MHVMSKIQVSYAFFIIKNQPNAQIIAHNLYQSTLLLPTHFIKADGTIRFIKFLFDVCISMHIVCLLSTDKLYIIHLRALTISYN
jgi:hypothetical protein